MQRRRFITFLGGAAAVSSVSWPLAGARAQGGRTRRIGVLMGTNEADGDQQAIVSAFVQALAALGWRSDGNIRIEYRWAGGDPVLLRSQAADLARLSLDAIFVQGTPASGALRQTGTPTPIVFMNVIDPVASGLVASLARPGANLTGFTNFEESVSGKWLEILKEIAPAVSRVAVLLNPDNVAHPVLLRTIEALAPRLSVQVEPLRAHDAGEIERSFASFAARPGGGLISLPDFFMSSQQRLITTMAASHRLPAVYGLREYALSGGLICYGPDSLDLARRAAAYVDRILKGEKPADLPVQLPIKFAFVINLKAAMALDLTIPATMLGLADEVIE